MLDFLYGVKPLQQPMQEPPMPLAVTLEPVAGDALSTPPLLPTTSDSALRSQVADPTSATPDIVDR